MIRVVFDGDIAVGVEVTPTPGPADEVVGPTRVVRARRMVVLAGGCFGSPAVLERSGIGNPKVLEPLGVRVKVDLPGVGKDYLDHHVSPPSRWCLSYSLRFASVVDACAERAHVESLTSAHHLQLPRHRHYRNTRRLRPVRHLRQRTRRRSMGARRHRHRSDKWFRLVSPHSKCIS